MGHAFLLNQGKLFKIASFKFTVRTFVQKNIYFCNAKIVHLSRTKNMQKFAQIEAFYWIVCFFFINPRCQKPFRYGLYQIFGICFFSFVSLFALILVTGTVFQTSTDVGSFYTIG
jgi:hypothetical protein